MSYLLIISNQKLKTFSKNFLRHKNILALKFTQTIFSKKVIKHIVMICFITFLFFDLFSYRFNQSICYKFAIRPTMRISGSSRQFINRFRHDIKNSIKIFWFYICLKKSKLKFSQKI
jgi:hypothetical protein